MYIHGLVRLVNQNSGATRQQHLIHCDAIFYISDSVKREADWAETPWDGFLKNTEREIEESACNLAKRDLPLVLSSVIV